MNQKNPAVVETSPRRPPSLLTALLASIVGILGATGCASVAPYERAKLAHPTMGAADSTSAGESHVRDVQEGAIGGAGSGSGSGCGCN